ncbi:MAG TPA: methyl-accepting chemotaxis protein [Aggregicoccus sp.]|nr:methyl-accepting chemotaxis protein [Aggregicoccus sp.]
MNRRDLSLRDKLVLLVSGLLALVVVCFLLVASARMDSLAREWTERRARGVAQVLGRSVAPALEFDDAATVGELLAGLGAAPESLYAVLLDAQGKPFAQWHPERAPQLGGLAEGEDFQATDDADALHVRARVRTRTGQQGTLALGFSLAELAQQKRTNTVFIAVLGLALLGLGVVLSFFAGNVLSRPLARMAKVAQHIASGDLAAAQAGLGGEARVLARAQRLEAAFAGRDEVRQLSSAFAAMLSALRDTSSGLHDAVHVLSESVAHLHASSEEQGQDISLQAAALEQTRATAEELRQTFSVALAHAQEVLQVAERASAVNQQGRDAIAQSHGGLEGILGSVDAISRNINDLAQRTRQIENITETVKDLADQSNLLALNAAIEAARAGEAGRSFAVVAREMRQLADQSIQGTSRAQTILGGVTDSTREAVSITGEGVRQIERGLKQVAASGDNFRALSDLVQESSDAVKQIVHAMSQQSAAFGQILDAVSGLSDRMGATVQRIERTNDAVEVLRQVSGRISGVAGRYRV